MKLMHLFPAEEDHLDSFAGLLSLSLLLHLILTGSFVHMSWSFALRLFRTYQTEVWYVKEGFFTSFAESTQVFSQVTSV